MKYQSDQKDAWVVTV